MKLGNLYAWGTTFWANKKPPLRISDWTLQKKGGVEMYGRSVLHLVLSGCFQSRKDTYSNPYNTKFGKVSIKFNHVNPQKTLPHVIFAFMSAYLSQGGNDCTRGRGGGGLQLRGDFDERLDAGETLVLIRRVKQQSMQDMNIIRSPSLVRCHFCFRECNWCFLRFMVFYPNTTKIK